MIVKASSAFMLTGRDVKPCKLGHGRGWFVKFRDIYSRHLYNKYRKYLNSIMKLKAYRKRRVDANSYLYPLPSTSGNSEISDLPNGHSLPQTTNTYWDNRTLSNLYSDQALDHQINYPN